MKQLLLLLLIAASFASCSKKDDPHANVKTVLYPVDLSTGKPYVGMMAYPTGEPITIDYGVKQKNDKAAMSYSLKVHGIDMNDNPILIMIDTGTISKNYINKSLESKW